MQKANFNKNIVKSFFQQKINLWIILVAFIVFAVIYCFFELQNRNIVFPSNKEMKFEYFTDADVEGKSQVNNFYVSDSAVLVSFVLKEGFVNPYVGINICRNDNKPFDISDYNQLQFEIEGKEFKNLLIAVITQNKNGIKTVNDFYLNQIIEISENKQKYTLDFDQLKLPDWWYYVNKLTPDKNLEPDFQHVLRINFVNGSTEINEKERSIRLYSLVLVRNNNFLLVLLCVFWLTTIFILFVIHYFKTRTKYKSEHVQPIVITYQPVNTEDDSFQSDKFMDYIHKHFSDSNLSLETVAEQTGVNARRIANTIMQQYGCNFKTYINQIRITEAKRLLKETGLNIGEIAFKVGFNSPNHFNRVFKTIEGKSPSEIR